MMRQARPIAASQTVPSSPSRAPAEPVTLAEAVRAYWLDQMAVIDAQLARMDQGTIDAGAIHDLRVAGRRATSIGRLSQPFLAKGWAKTVSAALRPIRKATNPLRDDDVLLDRLSRIIEPDPLAAGARLIEQEIASERQVLLEKVMAKLRSRSMRKRLSALKNQLEPIEAVLDLLAASPDPSEPISIFSLTGVRLAVLSRQAASVGVLRSLTPAPGELPADILADPELKIAFLAVDEKTAHQIRLAFKDLRYAVEFLKPALSSQASRLIRLCKKQQDRLGTLHDLDMAIRRLESFPEPEPRQQTGPEPAESTQDRQKIISAWRLERQTLMDQFLKDWYKMNPVWLEQQLLPLLD
jgi:CHAD domain-containing protein